MYNYLPGTDIELDKTGDVSDFLGSLFSAGGLVLSQVLSLTGLSAHTVQNWVKRKYLKPPVNKKYNRRQFCTLAILNLLGGTFSFENIRRLIDYAEVLDENAAVYIYTVFVKAVTSGGGCPTVGEAIDAIDGCMNAEESRGEAKERLRKVLRIMVMAHLSAVIRLDAQNMLDALDV